jgi:hypothetical protein
MRGNLHGLATLYMSRKHLNRSNANACKKKKKKSIFIKGNIVVVYAC